MDREDSWIKRSWSQRWGLIEHPHRDAILTLMSAHDYLWNQKDRPVGERIAACTVLYELACRLVWE